MQLDSGFPLHQCGSMQLDAAAERNLAVAADEPSAWGSGLLGASIVGGDQSFSNRRHCPQAELCRTAEPSPSQ